MRKLINLLPLSRTDAAKVADVIGSIPIREFVATTLFISMLMIALPFALLAFSARDAWL